MGNLRTATEEAVPQLTTRWTSLAMAPAGARNLKLPIDKQEIVKLPKLGVGGGDRDSTLKIG